METVERIAKVVLYEGYLLYPYTRSAMKNQQRWTFGGVYPRRHSEVSGGNDPWIMQTQCLVLGDAQTELEIRVRFLHLVDRMVLEYSPTGTKGDPRETGHPQGVPLRATGTGRVAEETGRLVAEFRVGDQVYRPWEEAVERELVTGPVRVGDLIGATRSFDLDIPAGGSREPLLDPAGVEVGALLREWRSLRGEVAVAVEPVLERCYRLTVTITNTTPRLEQDALTVAGSDSGQRRPVLRHTMISTHTILRVQEGKFVSLLEPPQEYAAAAAGCKNIKTWPVLVGESGERHTLLSSPIILYDYPEVAPESPGDLFDATEIDELLTLSVMTLTDEEKQEMRESDPRGREILARTEALSPEQLLRLHGTIRDLQALRPEEP